MKRFGITYDTRFEHRPDNELMASQERYHQFRDERKEGQKGRRSGPSGVVHLKEVDVLQQRLGISNPSPCLRRLRHPLVKG